MATLGPPHLLVLERDIWDISEVRVWEWGISFPHITMQRRIPLKASVSVAIRHSLLKLPLYTITRLLLPHL